jgi:tetratricopeptide (TPR) repeat protein
MITALLSLALLAAPPPVTTPQTNEEAAESYYTPAEAQALFEQGNQAFAKEDYAQAQDAFTRLLAHGFGGPDVHYNLGTVALAQGDLGHAVLELERARREGGSAADLDGNLALARSKQLDKVIGVQAEDSVAVIVAEQTPTRPVGFVLLGSWALAFAALIALRFRPRGRRQLLALVSAAGFAIAVVSGAFLAFQAYVARDRVVAVVVDKTAPAHELPDPNAKVTFEVHAGLEVRLGEAVDDYVHIRLPNGLEGWALRESLEPI